jgi:hypothetical protein
LSTHLRIVAAATILFLIVALSSMNHSYKTVVEAAEDEITVKPPLQSGSGIGSFNYLDQAIDDNVFNGAQSALSVDCKVTCLAQLENVAVWQGFPNGAEPLRLEITWDGNGGIGASSQAQAYFLIEYDIGNGWEIAEQDLWVNAIPSCSPAHPAACPSHVFVKQLNANVVPSVVKVRATHRMKMNVCPTCGTPFSAIHHMLSSMQVRNIEIVSKAPTLVADPSATVTRGDGVTFFVRGAPEGTTYSNWRYEMTAQPTITRTGTVNVDTWTGEMVLSGTAKVVALIPRNLLSRHLSAPLSVTPRNWNSEPRDPTKVTGLGPIPSPPQPFPAKMGWALIDADFLWDGHAVPDGPNKGLSYVTMVRHDDVPGTRVEYEISKDMESGMEFYNKQCGLGGFITGAVLRANGYEHESGTTKGHNQQYRSKLAEPAVNYAKWAENQIGSVSGGFGGFSTFIFNGLMNRKSQVNAAASVEACNTNFSYDASCTFRGNINFPPYQSPCQ